MSESAKGWRFVCGFIAAAWAAMGIAALTLHSHFSDQRNIGYVAVGVSAAFIVVAVVELVRTLIAEDAQR